MSDDGRYDVPKSGLGDRVHTLAKAVASAFPILGGPAAELFNMIVIPPLSKRRDEWMQNVGMDLLDLKQKIKEFNPEDLAQDEVFITSLLTASQAAMKTHHEEKLKALRNAVLNAALPNAPDEDLQLMFLELVDSMSPSHLRVLNFIDTSPECKGGPDGLYRVVESKFPQLQKQHEFLLQVIRDLEQQGLITDDRPNGVVWPPTFIASTSQIGKQFLAFITSPV